MLKEVRPKLLFSPGTKTQIVEKEMIFAGVWKFETYDEAERNL